MLLANKEGVDGKKTNNPHWALTGDTGNGKSVTAKTLFMQMALLKDRVLYIDPKKKCASNLCIQSMTLNIKRNIL